MVSEELELADGYAERWIQGTLRRLQEKWPRVEYFRPEPEAEAPEPVAPLASPRDPDEASDDDDATMGMLTSSARYGPDGMPLDAEQDGATSSPAEQDKAASEEFSQEVGAEDVPRESKVPPSAWRAIDRPPCAAEKFVADTAEAELPDAAALAQAALLVEAAEASELKAADEAAEAPNSTRRPACIYVKAAEAAKATKQPETAEAAEAAEAPDLTEQAELEEPMPPERARFLLRVQLNAGREEPLEFGGDENVRPKLQAFVGRHDLDDSLEDLLAEHAEGMVRDGRHSDVIDAMDLLMRDMRSV